MPGLVIASDIDDVVSRHAEGWANFHCGYGDNVTPLDCRDDWQDALPHLLPDELEERKIGFFTEDGVGQLEVIEGAVEGIERLTDYGDVIFMTARRATCEDVTRRWVKKYFGSLVTDIMFATHFIDGVKVTIPKSDMSLEIGADILIEDQPKHCLAVDSVGVKALQYGDYPWTNSLILPPSVVRTPTWKDVIEYMRVTYAT